jgi:hypothetical protein
MKVRCLERRRAAGAHSPASALRFVHNFQLGLTYGRDAALHHDPGNATHSRFLVTGDADRVIVTLSDRNMTRSARCVASLLIALQAMFSVPVTAQVIPGKWQKVDLLTAGSEVIIRTNYGETLDCFYFSLTDEFLLVVESISREQRRIPKSSIKQITARRYDDRLRNGALLGLTAGAVSGIAITTATSSRRHKNTAADRVFGSLLFGLLGMGVGVLIDYRHKGDEVLYQAPETVR